ncbi:MAG: hypothetical protein E6Q92_09920 [Burkholderiaceae bacterium]|nr:MAG: hypothetical protein E6Q92_09920 [Burkholderiaceae bacterium]
MNTIRTLADTLVHTSSLDLQGVRRLAWFWQGLITPGAERTSPENFAKLYTGEPAPAHDAVMTCAGLIALLPASLSARPLMGERVRDILLNYNAMEKKSPFALVRTWSGLPNNLLAAQLEMKPGRLRELCRAQWCHHSADSAFIAELACLGLWFGGNAVSISKCGEALVA